MLVSYVDLLREWNAKVNLVSRRDEESIWGSHILHSLAPWFLLEFPDSSHVLDLGSGGGLPGIPLAVMRPDVRVTLLDSIRKKTVALEDMVRRLGLTNVTVVNARAEDASREARHAGKFTAVVARAVAPLADLVRWSRPFLARRSAKTEVNLLLASSRRVIDRPCLIALKGGNLEEEIRTASLKTGERRLEVLDLVFEGSHELAEAGKKAVLVWFGGGEASG